MSSISAISLSGMNAAQIALHASGHNIANLGTAGFRREQVSKSSNSTGGVTSSLTRVSELGNAIETDMLGQLVAKNSFAANLVVFKIGDRMLGALLDATT